MYGFREPRMSFGERAWEFVSTLFGSIWKQLRQTVVILLHLAALAALLGAVLYGCLLLTPMPVVMTWGRVFGATMFVMTAVVVVRQAIGLRAVE